MTKLKLVVVTDYSTPPSLLLYHGPLRYSWRASPTHRRGVALPAKSCTALFSITRSQRMLCIMYVRIQQPAGECACVCYFPIACRPSWTMDWNHTTDLIPQSLPPHTALSARHGCAHANASETARRASGDVAAVTLPGRMRVPGYELLLTCPPGAQLKNSSVRIRLFAERWNERFSLLPSRFSLRRTEVLSRSVHVRSRGRC